MCSNSLTITKTILHMFDRTQTCSILVTWSSYMIYDKHWILCLSMVSIQISPPVVNIGRTTGVMRKLRWEHTSGAFIMFILIVCKSTKLIFKSSLITFKCIYLELLTKILTFYYHEIPVFSLKWQKNGTMTCPRTLKFTS